MPRKSLSPTKRLKVLLANEGKCYLCDGKILAGDKWEVEHPRALALLGEDDESNWRPSHIKCHEEKTAEDMTIIVKAKRIERKHRGAHRAKQPFRGWRKFSGDIVWNDKR